MGTSGQLCGNQELGDGINRLKTSLKWCSCCYQPLSGTESYHSTYCYQNIPSPGEKKKEGAWWQLLPIISDSCSVKEEQKGSSVLLILISFSVASTQQHPTLR